jgi:hypothetical protein
LMTPSFSYFMVSGTIVKCVEYFAAGGLGSRLQPLAAVKCRSHLWARISEKNHRALLALRGAMSAHAVEQFAEPAAVCGNLPALRGGGDEDARNGSAVDCQNAAHIQSGDEGQEYPGRLLPLKSTCFICPEAGTRVPRRARSPNLFSNLASCATASCVCDCMYTSSPPQHTHTHTHTHTHIPHPPTQRFVRNHLSILSGFNCVAFVCPFCVRVPLARRAGVKYINWTGLKEVFLYI